MFQKERIKRIKSVSNAICIKYVLYYMIYITVQKKPTKPFMSSIKVFSYGKVFLNSSSMLSVRREANFILRFIFFRLWTPPFSTTHLSILWKPRAFVLFCNKTDKMKRHLSSSHDVQNQLYWSKYTYRL